MIRTPTAHEKAEWSRMAQDAYASDRNFYGHRYSGAAALRHDDTLPLTVFDTLQRVYRLWLVGGWANVEHPV
jgi:hypothetical protein